MEPYIAPLHSSSPPPLDDDGEGEAAPEDDDFGDFGGFCSSGGVAAVTEPPSTFREASRASLLKEAQTEPSPSSGSVRGQVKAESSLHLTNGYAEGDLDAAVGTFSPREETGFADFTVFTEQAVHPWCCGLAPLNSTESWTGDSEGTNLAENAGDPGQQVVLDSDPGPHCASGSEGNVCTDAAVVQPSQEQPRSAAAALGFPCEDERGDRWREGSHCLNNLKSSEEQAGDGLEKDRERSISTVPWIISAYESASEDLESDFSFEGVSADLEPIVSSLASQDDQTDWDQTDAEDEELGNNWHSDSFGSGGGRMAGLSQTEAQQAPRHCDPSATQETSATSSRAQSVTCTGNASADEDGRVCERQPADVSVRSLGSLPPSDSFADFCSAPTQEGGVSSLQDDGFTEEEQGRVERNSFEVSFSCRVQQVLRASFPEVVPTVEGEEEETVDEEEVLSLCSQLRTRHLPESEEEKAPELSDAQGGQRGLWWPQREVHSALGLQFQWGGSHTNSSLLRCLGVDTRNIVFMGMKKQPLAVPAFASGLGMLEPTKDAAPAVCTSGSPAVAARDAAGPQNSQGPSAGSVQEALPSSQLDWSRRGLSGSQDGCCALNLDYFGPEDDSRSCSSNSPPPGVDRDLYELTISKLEPSMNSCHLLDTLSRLMSEAQRTSTSVRKPAEDEEVGEEARRVIAALPDLSFMKAKVLMFPSVLVPTL